MPTHPVELKRTEDRCLEITWSDGAQQRTAYRQLRDHCPCATCRQPELGEKKSPDSELPSLRVLSAAETLPLEIVAMNPVGNYAYNVQFSDGHNTGIFTYDLLRALGESN